MLNFKKPLRHKAKGITYHYVGTIPDGDHVLTCQFNDGYWSLSKWKDQQLNDEFENVVVPEYLWANVYHSSPTSYHIGQVMKTTDELNRHFTDTYGYTRLGVIRLTIKEGKLTNVDLVDPHNL